MNPNAFFLQIVKWILLFKSTPNAIAFLDLEYIFSSWKVQFSKGSIIAIFHDVLITIGLFSLLSLEINLSIVAAVLTIVGYSMNDTVVIYDRIRENLIKYSSLKIGEISNKSINETLSRTVITSTTTLLALISIFHSILDEFLSYHPTYN